MKAHAMVVVHVFFGFNHRPSVIDWTFFAASAMTMIMGAL